MLKGGSYLIKIIDLCKSFGGKSLYKNFNLEINDGEFVILSGESGCGKTTLLNMIGAIEPIDRGSIIVDDVDITKRRNKLNYFRTKIGILFQNFALIDNLTVKSNINLIHKKCRNSTSITEVLKSVGLSEKINNKICTLSGGEQQRVALARLMIKKCNIILADEPTGSLDKKNAEVVIGILKSINSSGKTVIMVTHDEELKKIGDRNIELKSELRLKDNNKC